MKAVVGGAVGGLAAVYNGRDGIETLGLEK